MSVVRRRSNRSKYRPLDGVQGQAPEDATATRRPNLAIEDCINQWWHPARPHQGTPESSMHRTNSRVKPHCSVV